MIRHGVWLVLAGAAVGMYFVPLTSPDASVQWDAVDVHFSLQRYLAEQWHGGVLPFWAPYLFSGLIEGELFVRAFLASSGAYVLARCE